MSVNVDEILSAARTRRAAITAETAGYLLLAVADALGDAPGTLDAASVHLIEDGSVRAVRSRSANGASLEADFRGLLARLLQHAPPAPPALSRVAVARQDGGLRQFVGELEAALIPVNRSAARRALARLHRDVARSRSAAPPAPAEPVPAPASESKPSLEAPVATPRVPPEMCEAIPIATTQTPPSMPAPETTLAPESPPIRPNAEVKAESPAVTPTLARVEPPVAVPIAARPVIALGDSIVETLVPPSVALAPKPAAAGPRFETKVVASPVLAGLVPVVEERTEFRDTETDHTPFLGSLEVALRQPVPAPSSSTDSDTERLPPVTWEETEERALANDTNVEQAPAAVSAAVTAPGADRQGTVERDDDAAVGRDAVILPKRIVEIGNPASVAVVSTSNVESDIAASESLSAEVEASEDAAVVAAVTGDLAFENAPRVGVPAPAPESEKTEERAEGRKSVPAPKSFAPVPPVVRALKWHERPIAHADEMHAGQVDEPCNPLEVGAGETLADDDAHPENANAGEPRLQPPHEDEANAAQADAAGGAPEADAAETCADETQQALLESATDVPDVAPTVETQKEPSQTSNDADLPENSSLFDLSDGQFSEPSCTPVPVALDAGTLEVRASLSEARESLHEAEESLLDAWAESVPPDSDVACASAPPVEVAPISVSEPTPSVVAPLYRRRESDVRDLLSQFVVAEARSLRDLARELKTMAGINATPAPPAVLPVSPEKAAGRR